MLRINGDMFNLIKNRCEFAMAHQDYIDQMVINEIYRTGDVRDKQLSKQLGCARMLLLNRLSDLISEGYVIDLEDGYALTEKGKEIRKPDNSNHSEKVEDAPHQKDFIWDNLYVPPQGWDAE